MLERGDYKKIKLKTENHFEDIFQMKSFILFHFGHLFFPFLCRAIQQPSTAMNLHCTKEFTRYIICLSSLILHHFDLYSEHKNFTIRVQWRKGGVGG